MTFFRVEFSELAHRNSEKWVVSLDIQGFKEYFKGQNLKYDH